MGRWGPDGAGERHISPECNGEPKGVLEHGDNVKKKALLGGDWGQVSEKQGWLIWWHSICARLGAGSGDSLSLSLRATLKSGHCPCFTDEGEAPRACLSPKTTLLARYGTKI